MPFDPRLINPDDAPEDALGEIDLPDDLLELAAQLRDDAVYLSERYPAAVAVSPAPTPLAISGSNKRHHIVLAISGLAAACALIIGLAYRPQSPPREVASPAADPTTHIAMVEPRPSQPEIPVSTPASNSPRPRIERLPWAPQPALGEVTGPELEGLLDLWQNDEHPAETRISI